jgi:hypothetical protein
MALRADYHAGRLTDEQARAFEDLAAGIMRLYHEARS